MIGYSYIFFDYQFKMGRKTTISVECNCGLEIAIYQKETRGRLRKMYIRKILEDKVGIFLTDPPLENDDNVLCPECDTRLATIQMIHGMPAAKMNQGGIKRVGT